MIFGEINLGGARLGVFFPEATNSYSAKNRSTLPLVLPG